jgi:AraC-like DNA-binding protein
MPRRTAEIELEPRPVFARHHAPRGPLADFVALFWHWRGHTSARSTERLLPMPTMELVFQLAGSRVGGGVAGPHSEVFFIERSAQDELLGVHFKPGGAFPFLGVPAGDLHNRYVELDDLWGERDAASIVARLREAPTSQAKFALLEGWLLGVAPRPLARNPAAKFALAELHRDSSVRSSADVARTLGISQRRFIQLFRGEIGLTPKLYSRIERFQHVLRRVELVDEVDWVDVATSCGYFDQAHFIHDFREFTGLRPSDYLGLRIAGQRSHVRVPD